MEAVVVVVSAVSEGVRASAKMDAKGSEDPLEEEHEKVESEVSAGSPNLVTNTE